MRFLFLFFISFLSSLIKAESIDITFNNTDEKLFFSGDTASFVFAPHSLSDENYYLRSVETGKKGIFLKLKNPPKEIVFSLSTGSFNPSAFNYVGVVLRATSSPGNGDVKNNTWRGNYLHLGGATSLDKVVMYRKTGVGRKKNDTLELALPMCLFGGYGFKLVFLDNKQMEFYTAFPFFSDLPQNWTYVGTTEIENEAGEWFFGFFQNFSSSVNSERWLGIDNFHISFKEDTISPSFLENFPKIVSLSRDTAFAEFSTSEPAFFMYSYDSFLSYDSIFISEKEAPPVPLIVPPSEKREEKISYFLQDVSSQKNSSDTFQTDIFLKKTNDTFTGEFKNQERVEYSFYDFMGKGFAPSREKGMVNSKYISIKGASDGDILFSESKNTVDFARGNFSYQRTGGIYSFSANGFEHLLLQGNLQDFSPGTVILKFANKTKKDIYSMKFHSEYIIPKESNDSVRIRYFYSLDSLHFHTLSATLSEKNTVQYTQTFIKNQETALLNSICIPPEKNVYLKIQFQFKEKTLKKHIGFRKFWFDTFDTLNKNQITIKEVSIHMDTLQVEFNANFFPRNFPALAIKNIPTEILGFSTKGKKTFFLLDTIIPFLEKIRATLLWEINSCGITRLKDEFSIFSKNNPPVLYNEVSINEINFDTNPFLEATEYEYLELFNHFQKPLRLERWKIQVNETTWEFSPLDSIKEYLTLFGNKAQAEKYDGIYLKNFSLPANGGKIVLKNESENVLDLFVYDKTHYLTEEKSEGGWALEKISPSIPCIKIGNWAESINPKGGTPQKRNSQLKNIFDDIAPKVLSLKLLSGNILSAKISEVIPVETVHIFSEQVETRKCVTENGTGYDNEIICSFDEPLLNKKTYFFSVALFDCSKNYFLTKDIPISKGGLPQEGDIRFNEILFAPKEKQTEFIEFINTSEHSYRSDSLILIKKTSNTDTLFFKSHGFIIYPNDIFVITQENETFLQEFPNARKEKVFFEDIFPLNNEGATLILKTKGGKFIDEVTYSEKMHSSFLVTTKGVSLENDGNSWVSASSEVGGSTPTLPNSQKGFGLQKNKQMSVSKKYLRRNNGYSDTPIEIKITFPESGFLGSVYLLNERQEKIISFSENEYFGSEKKIIFDAQTPSGVSLRKGVYVVLLEAVSEKGITLSEKIDISINN